MVVFEKIGLKMEPIFNLVQGHLTDFENRPSREQSPDDKKLFHNVKLFLNGDSFHLQL